MWRPTYAEINTSAITNNIKAIRAKTGPNVKIFPAVKANGYGHGAIETSKACLEGSADALCVATLEEAVGLIDAGINSPILLLGCAANNAASEIVHYNVSAALCDISFAKSLSLAAQQQNKSVSVHIKIDTGMGRIGISPEDTMSFIKDVHSLPGLIIDGIFTHFPCADENDDSFTLSQIDTMKRIITLMRNENFPIPIVHAANSAGTLAFPSGYFDAVRPGIMIYGMYPSKVVKQTIQIKEALTLKTQIVFLKDAKPETTISYGRTHKLKTTSKIATIPIGYGDGYPRLLSNIAEASVNGVRVPLVGRICMDQCMLDVSSVENVKLGDEVILYGGGYDYLNVSSIADKIGMISYELFCGLSKRVPRVYI